MRVIYSIIALTLLLYWPAINGQAQVAEPKNIPPPPNAASLGIYGNVPVSLYNGLPNISIPIYTIKHQDITLPIALSYHAQGVKVDQDASWVGLGWSLNSGGVITRTIRGIDDLIPPGWRVGFPRLTDQQLPANKPMEDGTLFVDRLDGRLDTEQDLFFYNFAGYSGKFYLGRAVTANGKITIKGIPLAAEKISITYIMDDNAPNAGEWEVITADGFTYAFITKEYTFMRDSGSGSHFFTGDDGADARCRRNFNGSASPLFLNYTNDAIGQNYNKQVGSWQLDGITSPTGAKLNFVYDTENYASLSPLMRSEKGSDAVLVSVPGGSPFTSQMITKERLLKRIEFGQGKVEFFTQHRQDIDFLSYLPDVPSLNITPPQRLNQIKITHASSAITSVFDFVHGYFNEDKLVEFKRLKLVELVENGLKRHRFAYDERKPLPSKNTMDKDYWGYYNGEWNNYTAAGTELPAIKWLQPVLTDSNGKRVSYDKANNGSTTDFNQYYDVLNSSRTANGTSPVRKPDQGIVNQQTGQREYPYMQAGVLREITYPTGGKTSFDYEPHTYEHKYLNEDNTVVSLRTLTFNNNNGTSARNGFYEESQPFVIGQPTYVKISRDVSCGLSCNKVQYYNEDFQGDYTYIAIIPVSGSGTRTNLSFPGDQGSYTPPCKYGLETCDSGERDWGFSQFSISSKEFFYPLMPGSYKIAIRNMYTTVNGSSIPLRVDVKLTFLDFNQPTTQTGGGLRIKRITDSDGMTPAREMTKTYSYTADATGKSSGLLMSNLIKYYYRFDWPRDSQTGTTPAPSHNIRSFPTYPLSTSAQGSPVGYTRVTVLSAGTQDNGLVEYRYENSPDNIGDPLYEKIIPDFPSQNDNDQNGFVRQEHYWEKAGNAMRLIREISRDYSTRVVQQVKGVRVYRVSTGGGNWKDYFTKSKWRYYTEETVQEHDYDEAGNRQTLSHTQKTYHDQEKHFLPTRTEQETSDGKTLITYTKYPADYTDTEADAVINAMKGNKHIHNAPIQQTTTRKEGTSEVVLSSLVYRYGFGPANTFIKPLGVYQFRIPKPLKYNDPAEFPSYLPATWNYNDRSKLEPKISYRYDDRGNMIEYQREGDLPVTVLWSYNANYPVAQLRNASYARVEVALGGKAAVDAIAVSPNLSPAQLLTLNGLRAALPDAQVSTFTFDPLAGMTSATDPAETTTKYEYDPMGRLKCVRDHHNNILQHYLYHYKAQP